MNPQGCYLQYSVVQMLADNVSADVRQAVLRNFAAYVIGKGPGFGKRVGDRFQITELVVSIPCSEATAVCEIIVEEGEFKPVLWSKFIHWSRVDMLDAVRRVLHAGCSAYLIDM